MARISTDLFYKMTVKIPRGQQAYWDIIRTVGVRGQEFTLPQVCEMVEDHSASVRSYVRRLVKAKYLKKTVMPKQPDCFVILRAVINAPSIRPDGTECPPTINSLMWRTMLMTGVFDADFLVSAAKDQSVKLAIDTANKYLLALWHAGYLMVAKKHTVGNRACYQFKYGMKTGELAPQIMRKKIVWDRNLCQVMGDDEFQEVAA